MAKEDTDVKAMEMIKASGILNPNTTLEHIMSLTTKLAEMAEPQLAHSDTFIHKHFIYRHDD